MTFDEFHKLTDDEQNKLLKTMTQEECNALADTRVYKDAADKERYQKLEQDIFDMIEEDGHTPVRIKVVRPENN